MAKNSENDSLSRHDSGRCPECKGLGDYIGIRKLVALGDVRVWTCGDCNLDWWRP